MCDDVYCLCCVVKEGNGRQLKFVIIFLMLSVVGSVDAKNKLQNLRPPLNANQQPKISFQGFLCLSVLNVQHTLSFRHQKTDLNIWVFESQPLSCLRPTDIAYLNKKMSLHWADERKHL